MAKDAAEAAKWWKKAAGDAEAQFALGQLYADGEGVIKDEAEAEKWFKEAAEQGHAQARAALQRMKE